jgi:hypothetical protein
MEIFLHFKLFYSSKSIERKSATISRNIPV